MTAIGSKVVSSAVISREQGAKLLDSADKIKEEVYKLYESKALQLSRRMTEDELSILVEKGYEEFTRTVLLEYDHPSYANYPQILSGSYRTDFFSDQGLYGRISRAIQIFSSD